MIIGKVMVDLRVGTKCFWACFFKMVCWHFFKKRGVIRPPPFSFSFSYESARDLNPGVECVVNHWTMMARKIVCVIFVEVSEI